MAPQASAHLAEIERQLKEIVQTLYNIIVQNIDHQGAITQEAMRREIETLVQQLVRLSQMAPSAALEIPPEVTSYVESSRNPDIFTREFVEMAQRMNQMLRGRTEALLLLRDTLARDIIGAIPELRDATIKVVESTGGKVAI